MWNKLVSWLAKKQIQSAYDRGFFNGYLEHKPKLLQSKMSIATESLITMSKSVNYSQQIKQTLQSQFYDALDKAISYEFYVDPQYPYHFQVKAKIAFILPNTQYPNSNIEAPPLIKEFIKEFTN